MGNMQNFVDIESYCTELSSITGIDAETIKVIVLNNFAKVCFSNELSFVDATANIETELNRLLAQSKFKIIASKNFKNIYTAPTNSVLRTL